MNEAIVPLLLSALGDATHQWHNSATSNLRGDALVHASTIDDLRCKLETMNTQDLMANALLFAGPNDLRAAVAESPGARDASNVIPNLPAWLLHETKAGQGQHAL